LIFDLCGSLIRAMYFDPKELREQERLCRRYAAVTQMPLACDAYHAVGDDCRRAYLAMEERQRWTQFWTQTLRNGIELDGPRWTAQGAPPVENATEVNWTERDEITPFVFQDRCLKPLGHPSNR
jgi:hypothetical protein